MHASRLALLVASVVGMICTFLPWVNVPFIGAVYGTQGDGWITLAVCAGAAVCVLVGDRRSPLPAGAIIGGAVCGVAASLIGVWKIAQLNNAMADSPFGAAVSIGPGLYLLVVAGVVIAILPPILTLRRPPAPQPHLLAPQGYWPAQPNAWPPNR